MKKIKNGMRNDMLISHITLIFLTQIYYNTYFTTSFHHIITSIWSQDFPGTLRSIFADCYWMTFFAAYKKYIFLNISAKLVLKNQEFCLNAGKFCFLAATDSSKNTGLPQFFFKVFWQLFYKNINFQTKSKRRLPYWLLWSQN